MRNPAMHHPAAPAGFYPGYGINHPQGVPGYPVSLQARMAEWEPGTPPDFAIRLEEMTRLVPTAEGEASIAVLDMGFEPRLFNDVNYPRGFEPLPSAGRSSEQHGTIVSKIAGGLSERMKVVPWTVVASADPDEWQRSVIDGILVAKRNDARVLNLSIDFLISAGESVHAQQPDMPRSQLEDVPSFEALVDAVKSAPDVAFVFSAGNRSWDKEVVHSATRALVEANCDNVLLVSSAEELQGSNAAAFSRPYDVLAGNWFAQGGNMGGGASFATPKVARALAHALRLNPELRMRDLRRLVAFARLPASEEFDQVAALELAAMTNLVSKSTTPMQAMQKLRVEAGQMGLREEQFAQLIDDDPQSML